MFDPIRWSMDVLGPVATVLLVLIIIGATYWIRKSGFKKGLTQMLQIEGEIIAVIVVTLLAFIARHNGVPSGAVWSVFGICLIFISLYQDGRIEQENRKESERLQLEFAEPHPDFQKQLVSDFEQGHKMSTEQIQHLNGCKSCQTGIEGVLEREGRDIQKFFQAASV